MVEYDSDSSGADDIETGVTLGYASKEPTGDDFSQLGGHPVSLYSKHIIDTDHCLSHGSILTFSHRVTSQSARFAMVC